MFVIVGLGNPGKKYEGTRHNVGFEAVDYLAFKNNIQINKIKHKALIGEGTIEGKKVMIVKPQTFMNLSGESVRDIYEYYNIDTNKLVVIYDDIDIELGRLRIRKKGSAGTHNGMKNIIYHIKDDNFPRIRIGIGSPKGKVLANYVLSKFAGEEKEDIILSIRSAAEAVECTIKENIDKAMNQYNK